jgi:hypothetical protein
MNISYIKILNLKTAFLFVIKGVGVFQYGAKGRKRHLRLQSQRHCYLREALKNVSIEPRCKVIGRTLPKPTF